MSTSQQPLDRDTDQDGAPALLVAALTAVVVGVLWGLVILAVRWVLQLPPPALARVVGVGALLAGTALMVFSLVQVELAIPPSSRRIRGRRPSAAPARRGRVPSRADGSTTPPQAGGRALPGQAGRE